MSNIPAYTSIKNIFLKRKPRTLIRGFLEKTRGFYRRLDFAFLTFLVTFLFFVVFFFAILKMRLVDKKLKIFHCAIKNIKTTINLNYKSKKII
jgi:hypothetical protein